MAKPVQALDANILYLQQNRPEQALLSNIFNEPADSGLPGAQLAIEDNSTTGRFLQHHYKLTHNQSPTAEPLVAAAVEWVQNGEGLIVANVASDTLLQLANHPALRAKAVIINTGSGDDSLRHQQCTTGLLHTAASRAMLADALAQLLVSKRWQKWFLMRGQRPEDSLFASAMKRAAKRFGASIVEDKTWSFNTDLRRVAQQEIPTFTRARAYDVVVVADELGDVGEYVPYNTWLPRPVAGTQGLTPTAWHRVVEQWGAIQLQNRFEDLAQRAMNGTDYATWLAVRVIGEAVTRTNTTAATDIYKYILSPEFEVAAFKGRKMNFRSWNGQMRQPIALVHPRALISQSPQEGFLHPHTDLDTLGYDKPEVNCSFKTQLD
ncbi:ABC transporter substrate-binding protein [Halioxenophilus aromaticivorans]